MLLHALLDGHPEMIHIPQVFKYYDFVAATPDLIKLSGEAIVDAFVAYRAHRPLFDSHESVLLRGRLGPRMDDRVIIDPGVFREVMTSLLLDQNNDPRRVLFAAILAHAWCQGQQVSTARVVFMHIHHGDWLWPDALAETSNLSPHPLGRGIDILAPDKLLVTVRNPADQVRSYERFVNAAVPDETGRRVWFERYLRMLVQDWKRFELVKESGIPLKVVRLEDLRDHTRYELEGVARWMGIGTSDCCLDHPTVFGLPWWGDIYSNPSRSPNSPEPIASPSALNADHVFLYSAVGRIVTSMKYPSLHCAGFAQLAMTLPLFPAPKRSWPVTPAQWKQDLASRHTFLEHLDRRHMQALEYEVNSPFTRIEAEANV